MSIVDIPVLDATRIDLRPGDLVLIRPHDGMVLTPRQARDVQDWLQEFIPDHRVCVLPFAADLALLSAEDLAYLTEEDDDPEDV